MATRNNYEKGQLRVQSTLRIMPKQSKMYKRRTTDR